MKPLTLVVALIGAFVVSANAADTFKIDSVHSFVLGKDNGVRGKDNGVRSKYLTFPAV